MKQNVEQFFAELSGMLPYVERAQRDIDRATARRLNLFSLYLARNEMALSTILRDLLDPLGPHGQGDLLLRLFIETIGFDTFPVDEKVKVTCEVQANGRQRIDLLLTSRNRFRLAIENKPWALEQTNQLEDYSNHLREQCGATERYKLVFLTGQTLTPTSIDTETWAEIGITLPYHSTEGSPSLKGWLTRCIQETRAEKLRCFLCDFEEYVAQNFPVLQWQLPEEEIE